MSAIPPLGGDAAHEAWTVRSLAELVARLRERHPDVPLAGVRSTARAALIMDPADVEVARLEAALRSARARIRDLERQLDDLRGARLDAWLGLEDERKRQTAYETIAVGVRSRLTGGAP